MKGAKSTCRETMRELRMFCLEKRRPWGGLIAAIQYLKGAIRKLVA